jgi:hypothetical protein
MTSRFTRISLVLTSAGCWLVIAFLIAVAVPLGMYIDSTLIPAWKAQGLMEVPFFWQIAIDASDVSRNRWYVVFPPLLLIAVGLTSEAVRRHREMLST